MKGGGEIEQKRGFRGGFGFSRRACETRRRRSLSRPAAVASFGAGAAGRGPGGPARRGKGRFGTVGGLGAPRRPGWRRVGGRDGVTNITTRGRERGGRKGGKCCSSGPEKPLAASARAAGNPHRRSDRTGRALARTAGWGGGVAGAPRSSARAWRGGGGEGEGGGGRVGTEGGLSCSLLLFGCAAWKGGGWGGGGRLLTCFARAILRGAAGEGCAVSRWLTALGAKARRDRF